MSDNKRNTVHSNGEAFVKGTIRGTKAIKKKYGNIGILVAVALIFVFLTGTFLFWKMMLRSGVEAAKNGFHNAYDNVHESMKTDVSKEAYDTALEKYKTTNNAFIKVDEIRNISDFRVLTVIEEEAITQSDEYTRQGITYWTRYRGKGVFSVNLQASEFIVDKENMYVLVRIPEPELTSFNIMHDSTTDLFYKDKTLKLPLFAKLDINNGSINNGDYSIGVNLAQNQEERAAIAIKNKITSKQSYYQSARKSAESQLTKLIKNLSNDQNDQITVEIEFYE